MDSSWYAAGRYRGRIKSFNAEKGFGSIESEEARKKFNRDVFLHKDHKGTLGIGDDVTFSIETNKRDMPQAKDITLVSKAGKGKGKAGGKGGTKDGKGKDGKGKDGKGRGKGKGAKGDKDGKEEKSEKSEDVE